MSGHGAPLVLHHGSAISGRERDLIVGYEFDAQEGMLINKEVTGLGGGSDGTLVGVPRQAQDRVMGKCLDFNKVRQDRVWFTQVGDTHTAGTIAVSLMRPGAEAGDHYIFGATAGATMYLLETSGTTLWLRCGNAGWQNVAGIVTYGKWHRCLMTWTATHAYVYWDGVPIVDFVTVMANDIGTARIGGDAGVGMPNFGGRLAEFKLQRYTFTAADVLRDYMEYAARTRWQDTLRTANVSSAPVAGATGACLENTRWQFQSTDVMSQFSIVDALELARASGIRLAKAIHCNGAGELYVTSQVLGIPAASPENAYGTFEFWVKKAAGTTTRIQFISDGNRPFTYNGYEIAISATEVVTLSRYTAGALANTVMTSAAGAIAEDTWTKFTVARRYDGRFTLYIDGVLMPVAAGANPGTDNMHTTGSYTTISVGTDDEVGLFSQRFGELT